MMKHSHFLIVIGGFFGLSAVMLGAFGAHALQPTLESRGTTAVWKTAVDYQMWHALALLLTAHYKSYNRAVLSALWCFSLGVLLFSGSLYWLALGGPRWLGPITPLGGLLFIAGWASLIYAALKMKHESVSR
ncbi:DUF423 domain-containing protein [Coraliomargarita sp. SDUM461004]|uniref:DUF423 domain-containing protein n=1 Tax=Thalassobacterium sedimentorum TaxID=3041258 RepID=A0ABU1AFM5_9BACT|nr:DUF423 domain-containing protein [Coraliomargarita sp. SDUM461004]MDQ8193591.1 DUF423 domain-containing protein [Coraliomargarita sp. SDUM461004]